MYILEFALQIDIMLLRFDLLHSNGNKNIKLHGVFRGRYKLLYGFKQGISNLELRRKLFGVQKLGI